MQALYCNSIIIQKDIVVGNIQLIMLDAFVYFTV